MTLSALNMVRRTVERTTGIRLFRTLPLGIDVFHDLRTLVPEFSPTLILDVGANIGQSAVEFARAFPSAKVICFEPVSETFRRLESQTSRLSRVRGVNIGLGSTASGAMMRIDGNCLGHRIVEACDPAIDGRTEEVTIDTLDRFCAYEKIDHISYLKIDTEGHDLHVLKGGGGFVGSQQVDFIQVEAAMNSSNRRHVSLESFDAHLKPFGYSRFALYQQTAEFGRRPLLRRADVVYISGRLAE